jgi:hypothetical protein
MDPEFIINHEVAYRCVRALIENAAVVEIAS